MTGNGARIIDGLRAAIANDLAAVTVDGVRWVRESGTPKPDTVAYVEVGVPSAAPDERAIAIGCRKLVEYVIGILYPPERRKERD